MTVRMPFIAALVATIALALLGGHPEWSKGEGDAPTWSSGGLSGLAPRPPASAGTPITVRLTSTVSSASARIGDRWTGIVVRPFAIGHGVIRAGTPVRGVVTGAREAGAGGRAVLQLAVRALTVGGRTRPLAAVTGAFVARETRGSASDEVVLKPRTVMVFTLDDRIALR